ncbi:unnamed protein product [Onchocerca flexuosa]|uniref:Uncharacterized protein n=1 Tax=Onchocerca flexuosa TaxID=387005 RepID=A0A3P8C0U9_9BILA|nr:unnamed protein product [Onchocerca flexuosa]
MHLLKYVLIIGQFIQDNKQPFERVINVNESYSNLNLKEVKTLDVEKLNKLISFVDKTWILPYPGTHEAVGSNFKYKQTCENIYRNHKDICQQIGFGTMCFNYCYEQGETLEFQCQDISDPVYCKNNSAYDIILTKYRNDAYKAKSYIHQMISRCYATAICDSQYGILNTTIIDASNENRGSDNADNAATNLRLTMDNINQQEISQIIQQRQSEIKPTRPIPIWQLLLLRHKMITTAKSFPIVKVTENNGLAEVSSKESSENFENMEITRENNSKEISIESNPEYKQEIVTEEITTSTKQTITKKNRNETQLMEQLWWLCKTLRQMNKNVDYLTQQ